jgi:hypothetical protein
MADSTDRIQALRNRVRGIEEDLNAFRRKSDKPFSPFGLSVRLEKMIRYTDEQDFAVLVQKVQGLRDEFNKLEADIEDEVQDASDGQNEDDDE